MRQIFPAAKAEGLKVIGVVSSHRWRIFLFAFATASLLMVAAPRVHAQAAPAKGAKQPGEEQGQAQGWTFTPFILFATRYNDNIFGSVSDPQSDTILRLTPGFNLVYLSPRTNFNFDYNITAEKYARHSDLSTWDEAQGGNIGVKHAFTRRFNAGIQGSYHVTHNPGRLTPLAGIVLERRRATRASIEPSFTYEFSRRTSADVFYQWTRADLSGGLRTDIGIASGAITRELSPRDSLKFRYQNISYDFSNDVSATSNLFTVGWSHAVAPTWTLLLRAGPRDTDGRVVPEALARFRYRSSGKAFSIAYQRTQTVILGQAEVVDVQGLTTSFTFAPNPFWSITFTPGYFHDNGPGGSADIYHLGFYIWYRFARHWSVGLTEDYRLQHGVFNEPGNPTVRRNIVGISLRWGLPLRGGNFERGEQPAPLEPLSHPTRPIPPQRSRTR